MIREQIKSAQITAMKAGDKERLAAVRLILAKLKDRDIELRTASSVPDDDASGGREELAAKEQVELDVIESFLPTQLSEDETKAAIDAIKAEVGAASLKDMGKVMAVLKERHGSVIDMSKASGMVKAALS